MTPLQHPDDWPPPSYPTIDDRGKSIFSRVKTFIRQRRMNRTHKLRVLEPIYLEILAQLEGRKGNYPFQYTSFENAVLSALRDAVSSEKGVPYFVHPDDPIELLFWGLWDDMTFLDFGDRISKNLGVNIWKDELRRWKRDNLTVLDMARQIAHLAKTHSKNVR